MDNKFMWEHAEKNAILNLEPGESWEDMSKEERSDCHFYEYELLKEHTITDSDGNKCNDGDSIRFVLELDKNKTEQIGRLSWLDDEQVFAFDIRDSNDDLEEVYWEEDMHEFHFMKKEF